MQAFIQQISHIFHIIHSFTVLVITLISLYNFCMEKLLKLHRNLKKEKKKSTVMQEREDLFM